MTSVVAFVSGMLCLVKAGRNMDTKKSQTIGSSAKILMAFVSSVLAIGLLAVSDARRNELNHIISKWKTVFPWVIAFAILFFMGNMFFFNGLVNAPNAGLARALMTVEIGALAILSWVFFEAPLPWVKIGGIILVSVGAVLVSI